MKKIIFVVTSVLIVSAIGLFIFLDNKKDVETLGLFNKLEKGQDVHFLVVGDSMGKSTGASNQKNRWTELISNSFKKEFNVTPTIDFLTKGDPTLLTD